MALSLSNLKSNRKRKGKRVGRGHGSGRGTYAGRGLKGQRARAGGRKNLKRRGLKQFLQQLPKSRGFRSMYESWGVVNIGDIEKKFDSGSVVTPALLIQKGLLKSVGRGVKILGQGKLTKKFTIQAYSFAKTAENAIKKAGGEVKLLTRYTPPAPVKKIHHPK